MHPAPVGAQPSLLAPFDDPSAPRAHLARGPGLIRLRIEVRRLLVLAFALGDLALGRLVPIFRRDVLGPFLATFGATFGYYVLLWSGREAGLHGTLPVFAAAWLPNVGFMAASGAMLLRRGGGSRTLPAIS